jgi:hypothetical protein
MAVYGTAIGTIINGGFAYVFEYTSGTKVESGGDELKCAVDCAFAGLVEHPG